MKLNEEIKEVVKKKYGEIATGGGGCCGSAGCGDSELVGFADSYDGLAGYDRDADLQLGCGLPTATAGIRPGDTVLDLGSGAGNDAFVARAEVGPEGRVIGLDMAPEMVERARQNAARLGHGNVEFVLGEIEAIPLPDDSVDVIVSNCVLNLVPDKARAFGEVHRVLKSGGHFSISDIVLEGPLPEALAEAAAAYVGCVAGAMQKEDYLEVIRGAGFDKVEVLGSREIQLPDSLIESILGPGVWPQPGPQGFKILSITVRGGA